MRFQGLDLNLLVALDHLLTEKSVSRTAEKMHLSQSATSSALARLRAFFEDELLVRVGRTMILTPRGTELSNTVRTVLLQVEGTVIRRPIFDPYNVNREFTLISSDYTLISGLAEVVQKIQEAAPGLKFHFLPPNLDPVNELERGNVDFLILPELHLSANFPKDILYQEEYCVACCDSNKLDVETLGAKEFLMLDHVVVQFPNFVPTYEAWIVDQFDSRRNAAVTTTFFSAVPFLLVNTNRVALMHRRLAKNFQQSMPLKIKTPPIPIPPMNIGLQWNPFSEKDECLQWVRAQLLSHYNP